MRVDHHFASAGVTQKPKKRPDVYHIRPLR
jgi:hypothetical protein